MSYHGWSLLWPNNVNVGHPRQEISLWIQIRAVICQTIIQIILTFGGTPMIRRPSSRSMIKAVWIHLLSFSESTADSWPIQTTTVCYWIKLRCLPIIVPINRPFSAISSNDLGVVVQWNWNLKLLGIAWILREKCEMGGSPRVQHESCTKRGTSGHFSCNSSMVSAVSLFRTSPVSIWIDVTSFQIPARLIESCSCFADCLESKYPSSGCPSYIWHIFDLPYSNSLSAGEIY